MILSLIAAASSNHVIGKKGALPWHLPAEMQHLRSVTRGKPAIMGRATYDSIAALGKMPLPGRRTIVLSRKADMQCPGCDVVHSLDEALRIARESGAEEACIWGGEAVYRDAMPLADRLYLTEVHTQIEDGDAFFPAVDFSDWRCTSEVHHPADADHAFAFTIRQFDRIAQKES